MLRIVVRGGTASGEAMQTRKTFPTALQVAGGVLNQQELGGERLAAILNAAIPHRTVLHTQRHKARFVNVRILLLAKCLVTGRVTHAVEAIGRRDEADAGSHVDQGGVHIMFASLSSHRPLQASRSVERVAHFQFALAATLSNYAANINERKLMEGRNSQ